MTTKAQEALDILPARADPIRIVPVHPVEELSASPHGAPPPPGPQLTYRGEPLPTLSGRTARKPVSDQRLTGLS